ncbi:MAG TPA: hypothetical protein VF323_02795 [Candidatus Limnocylindrales bacterium]
MNGTRRGSIVAATWLIGLGVVFLLQRSTGWTWSQAWPLFVILSGVASIVTTLFRRPPGLAGIWSFTWPVTWVLVGIFLLLSTTGQLDTGPGETIDRYWPWVAIALGTWFVVGAVLPFGRSVMERLALPLAGAADASVRIRFGAGELSGHAAASGNLLDGSFEGGVRHRSDGPNRIEIEQDTTYGLPWLDHGSRWDVGLTAEVPLDLRLDTGANRATLDLRDLRLRTLELHTGASETRVLLPRAAGATSVRTESGAASLTLEVPLGVAARIRSRMALGSSHIDQARFLRVADGYESPDYATSPNRVDIDVSGGVGSVSVVGGGA